MKFITQPDNAYNESRISLDGKSYSLLTQWVGRTESWYISLKTDEGDIVFDNVRLVPYVSLARHNTDLMPQGGNLIVQKLNPQTRDLINRNNLGEGKDYVLMYYNLNEASGFG